MNSAFLLLPVIFAAVLARLLRRRFDGRLQTLLAALVLTGVLTAVLTEVLSLFRLLTPGVIRAVWALSCVIALAAAWRAHPPAPLARISLRAILALVPLALPALLAAAVAYFSLQVIADAHLYHIPRIRFWLQNQSVAFYTAANLQQLYMPPWSEFAGLHYAALTGTFRGIGLVQTAAMAGSALAAAAIARLLRPEGWAPWIAAALSLSIPQGALQATDLKNDYVCALWTACALLFLLLSIQRPTRTHQILAGLSVGLAVLTKATAILFLAPAVLLVLAASWRVDRRIPWRFALILAVASLALNAPQFQRNLALFGSPYGCDSAGCEGTYPFSNSKLSLNHTIENIARNAGLHLQSTSDSVNQGTERLLRSGVALFGADIDDPRSIWAGQQFHVRAPHADPDLLGNTRHFLLALAAGLAALIQWRRLTPAHRILLASILGAAILFCLVLRWQEWHTRLHLPLFVLAAPLVAAAFVPLRAARCVLAAVALFLLAQTSLLIWRTQVVRITIADMLGRTEPALRHPGMPGIRAALHIRDFAGCNHVGMDSISALAMEDFPLGVLNAGLGPIRVDEINVRNVSARLSPGRSAAGYCALLCYNCADLDGREESYRRLGFVPLNETGVSAFLKPAAALAAGFPENARSVLAIDAGVADLSSIAESVSGFGNGEGWGRWTTAATASIALREDLPARMDVTIQAYAFGPNAGADSFLEIGGARYPIRFGANPTTVKLSGLRPAAGTRTLNFLIPHPASPAELTGNPNADQRKLGLAIQRITITGWDPQNNESR